MSEVSRTGRPDTAMIVHAKALTIETDGRAVQFAEDYELAPKDVGDTSVVQITLAGADQIAADDLVHVDPYDGDSLEAVRAALEALTVVERQLSDIDRRNRGVA